MEGVVRAALNQLRAVVGAAIEYGLVPSARYERALREFLEALAEFVEAARGLGWEAPVEVWERYQRAIQRLAEAAGRLAEAAEPAGPRPRRLRRA